MNELIQTPREQHHSSASPASLFDEAAEAQLPVTVSSGPYAEQLPVGNMTVGEIRQRFRDRLDLDPNSQAVLDGQEVRDDVTVRPGQALLFIRYGGEKGGW
jgi:hypothetical protein